MPFPWKKVKSRRISQLVNDHLHNSQKRRDGSSLVVETGFPTSLIDLFMKNREKLKKPSKKKRQISPPFTPLNDSVIAESQSSLSFPAPPPSPMNSPLRCPSPLMTPSLLPLNSVGANEVLAVRSSDGVTVDCVDERENACGEMGVDANTVLLVVLKMFLVVVLALGTKRLTVGITISAFLLFILDYVGKYACRFLKPCLEAKGVMRSTVKRVWRLLRFKDEKLVEKNGLVLSSGSKHTDQEIQVVELNCYSVNHVEEIQPEDEVMDESSSKGRSGYQEIESKEMVVMDKGEPIDEVAELKRKSRRAKIKSKMKKLVPKKLRSSRTERLEIVKEHSVQYENGRESESASELSSISSGRYKEEDDSMSAFDGGLMEVSEEADTEREVDNHNLNEIKDGLTWRYSVLCLIVLIGLIGGRGIALLLALSWLLLLKLGENLSRYMKVPVIWSFTDKPGCALA